MKEMSKGMKERESKYRMTGGTKRKGKKAKRKTRKLSKAKQMNGRERKGN